MKSIKQTKNKITEEKGRINFSKNALLHKSTEITGKLVKTNFFRTLEINQMLAPNACTKQEALTKKKKNLSETNSGILIYSTAVPISLALWQLEK